MAKKRALDLIAVFNWAFNIIDNDDIPAAEQLTLMHVINRANRAFFRPIPISAAKLAASMCKDKRSVVKAVESLESRGIIVKTEGGYVLGISEGVDGAADGGIVDANAGKNGATAEVEGGGEDTGGAEFRYFGAAAAEDLR